MVNGSTVSLLGTIQACPSWGSGTTSESCVGRAVAILREACATSVTTLKSDSEAWWTAYWPHSFLSLGQTRLEGFYYTQM